LIHKDKDTIVYNIGDEIVRTVGHPYNNYINVDKDKFVDDFIKEYRRLFKLCLNEAWEKTIIWKYGSINLKHNHIKGQFPKYLQVADFNCLKKCNTFLSGRIKSQILKDLSSLLKGLCQSCSSLKVRPTKPNVDNVNPEIPPKHIEIFENDNPDSYFTHYVKLINLTDVRNQNKLIPIRLNAMDEEYTKKGYERLNSVLLGKDKVDLRYKLNPKEKENLPTEKVGCDMGVRKILTTSKGEFCKVSKDGKTFEMLDEKISRRIKGSKGYIQALREMECYMQEIIGELDFSKFYEVRLEHNKGLKKNTGNSNHHWVTQTIVNKLKKVCQDDQVGYTLTCPPYKSQRCVECGFVHRKNRNKELFKCLNCHHEADADVNSAGNNEEDLPYDGLWSIAKSAKDSGFFWLKSGFTTTGCHASPDKKQ
jgi:predicted Zn-ribbon and HTH transcriptional regulator